MHRTLSIALLCLAATANAAPVTIQLPPDTSTLRTSDLPGYAVARQKCGICHSANYISFQPPNMNQAAWTTEMQKMQQNYGAPITDDEVKLIGAYLAVAYGSAKATDPSVVALAPPAAPVAAASTPDAAVEALLSANACLGCHAIDHKIVGPAFKDVAAKYKSDVNARPEIAARIRSGGSGIWGDIAMPPMPGIDASQADTLAAFVLGQ
jgi:cytochrome c